MKRLLFASLLFGCCVGMPAQSEIESFQQYRQDMLKRYDNYRRDLLNSYADYLDKMWEQVEGKRPQQRFHRPKPHTVPTAPSPQPADPQCPANPMPEPTVTPVPHPIPTEPFPQTPPPCNPVRQQVAVNFYGLQLTLPKVKLPTDHLAQFANGDAIKALNASNFETEAFPAFRQQVEKMQLADYFVLELVAAYTKSLLPQASKEARANLELYMLLLNGYDVRPGMDSGTPLLLVPYAQQVYSHSYSTLGDANYYVYNADLEKNNEVGTFRTPPFSSPLTGLRALDLVIHRPMQMNGNRFHYSHSYNGIQIEGTLDERLMKMVLHYPQMPIPCYAQSVLEEGVHREVESQMKAQIGTQKNLKNVNSLLHFVQQGFDYATDDEQFGFEKPFFFEELLYYPKCDCEDRSVFYATLLRALWQVDNHLVGFPNHECVALSLPGENIVGTFYTRDGANYYISDPTYLGSDTGMCAPNYLNCTPDVQPW